MTSTTINPVEIDLHGIGNDSTHFHIINKGLIQLYLKNAHETDLSKFDFELTSDKKFRITRWEYSNISQPSWSDLRALHNTQHHVDIARELFGKALTGHKTLYFVKSIRYGDDIMLSGHSIDFANNYFFHDLSKLFVFASPRVMSNAPALYTNNVDAMKITNVFVNIVSINWGIIEPQKRTIRVYYTVACTPQYNVRVDIIFKIVYIYDNTAIISEVSAPGRNTKADIEPIEHPMQNVMTTSAVEMNNNEEEVIVPKKVVKPSLESINRFYDNDITKNEFVESTTGDYAETGPFVRNNGIRRSLESTTRVTNSSPIIKTPLLMDKVPLAQSNIRNSKRMVTKDAAERLNKLSK